MNCSTNHKILIQLLLSLVLVSGLNIPCDSVVSDSCIVSSDYTTTEHIYIINPLNLTYINITGIVVCTACTVNINEFNEVVVEGTINASYIYIQSYYLNVVNNSLITARDMSSYYNSFSDDRGASHVGEGGIKCGSNYSHIKSYGSMPSTSSGSTCNSGLGGGVISITSDIVNIMGTIDVGTSSTGSCTGSAGSIKIVSQILSGNGALIASGGNTLNEGAGSGGRIIILTNNNTFVGKYSIKGGSANCAEATGGNGTLYERCNLMEYNKGICTCDSPYGGTKCDECLPEYVEYPRCIFCGPKSRFERNRCSCNECNSSSDCSGNICELGFITEKYYCKCPSDKRGCDCSIQCNCFDQCGKLGKCFCTNGKTGPTCSDNVLPPDVISSPFIPITPESEYVLMKVLGSLVFVILIVSCIVVGIVKGNRDSKRSPEERKQRKNKKKAKKNKAKKNKKKKLAEKEEYVMKFENARARERKRHEMGID